MGYFVINDTPAQQNVKFGGDCWMTREKFVYVYIQRRNQMIGC